MWGRKATVLSHKCREQLLDKLSVFFSMYLLEKRASISSPPLRPHTPAPKSARGRGHTEGTLRPKPSHQSMRGEGHCSVHSYPNRTVLARPLFFFYWSSVCFVADVYMYIYIYIWLRSLCYGFVCFFCRSIS